MIFDTHAHYNDETFDRDREDLLTQMEPAGIAGIVNVGASWEDIKGAQKLADAYPFIFSAVGLHPDSVGILDDEHLEEMRELCGREKTVAVGEIGLDYHWGRENSGLQRDCFILQLNLAKECDLPVNIHSRNAAQETFDIIRENHAGTTGGIIHCFSSSAEMALSYVRLGYYIGIGGVVTFKNARVMREVAAAVPLDHIVVETDCPYLAPAPHRGERNSSLNLPLVINKIAEIKGISAREVEEATFENALNVYPKARAYREQKR